MQTSSLQSIVNTTTFKDFHIPNSALCKSLEYHTHGENPIQNAVILQKKEPAAEKESGLKKILPLAFSAMGAFLSLAIINKCRGGKLNREILKNGKMLDKLRELGGYFETDSVKEILFTAGGALTGGLSGGFISDKNKENRKEKVKNSVFEMVNITVPTLFVVGMEKILGSFKNMKMNPAIKKALPIVLGVGLGAPAAAKISGAINKKAFKEDNSKQRHFRPKDYLVHIDDIVTAFALARLPFLKAIPFDKILTFIYIHCGYEAGSADTKGHGHHH